MLEAEPELSEEGCRKCQCAREGVNVIRRSQHVSARIGSSSVTAGANCLFNVV